MRTNIEIDDELMQQAMSISKQTTKRAVVEDALRLMVQLKLQGEAIEKLWGSATWVGPDDDWFAPDPLMAKETESVQGDTPSDEQPSSVENKHGHR